MEIRKLEPHDAEAYFQLRLEALYNNPEAFGSSYEEEKKQTSNKYIERFQSIESFTFGALDESKLFGVITLLTEKSMKLKHRTTIVAMYVTPEKRGKGIAKALMNKAINQARNMEGIEQIYLTVVSSNHVAKNLYTTLEFEVYGTEKRALKLDQTYLDEDLMVLFLNDKVE